MYWWVRHLDVGEERGALAHEVKTAAHEIPRGSHLGRVDVGLRHQTSPEQGGRLVGVDPVVLGLGTVNGTHVESMPQDEGNAFSGAEVCQPVPGVDAFDADDQVIPIRLYRGQELQLVAGEVPVQEHHSLLAHDADVHRPRVEIDAAVMLVLRPVEVHRTSSFLAVLARVYSPFVTALLHGAAWEGPESVSVV